MGGNRVLEGYFSSQGLPLRNVGSKPQAGLLGLQQQTSKGTQTTSDMKSTGGFCLPERRDGWRLREHLKGQHTKFHLQPLPLGSGRRREKWTRDA